MSYFLMYCKLDIQNKFKPVIQGAYKLGISSCTKNKNSKQVWTCNPRYIEIRYCIQMYCKLGILNKFELVIQGA